MKISEVTAVLQVIQVALLLGAAFLVRNAFRKHGIKLTSLSQKADDLKGDLDKSTVRSKVQRDSLEEWKHGVTKGQEESQDFLKEGISAIISAVKGEKPPPDRFEKMIEMYAKVTKELAEETGKVEHYEAA